MAGGEDKVVLDKLFSKGIIKNLGSNKTPDFYATVMENLRIKNGGITARKWTATIYDWSGSNAVQGITYNSTLGHLYVVQNGSFRKINLTNDPIDQTTIGSISHTGAVRFIVYGIYTIILTWAGYPWVYNGTALTQLTSSEIANNTNPSFWAKYAWFSVVNSSLNPNAMLISKPATLAAPTNIYSWILSWGSESITFDSEVLWFVSTLNFLRIFTETTLEYISRDNLTTAGGISSLFSVPIASGDELITPDAVCAANEFIFYMTKTRRIKTVNYVQGNPVPQVAVISEEINEYLQSELAEDNSEVFAYFDKEENLVKFHVRSLVSTVNDTFVIRDLNNQTWIIDKDKYYSGMTSAQNLTYAWSAFGYRVVQDEIGTDDDNSAVEWSFLSAPLIFGNPTSRKQIRGAELWGKVNQYGIINRQVLVDGNSTMLKQIIWSEIPWNGSVLWVWIGWSEIGWEPVWWELYSQTPELNEFRRVATQWAIRRTGNNTQISVYGGQKWQKFIIDYASITPKARVRANTSDKV